MKCSLVDCDAEFVSARINQVYCSGLHQRTAARRAYRARIAEWVRSYKVEKGCADCDYNEHHAGLEFDHLEPRGRDITKTIAYLVGKGSLESVQTEIAKCEVVCRTCHGIRTWKRLRQNGMGEY